MNEEISVSVQEHIDNIYEEMVYLCEVRGELDPESNAKIEKRIGELHAELRRFEFDAI